MANPERDDGEAARADRRSAVQAWEQGLRTPDQEEFVRIQKIVKDAATLFSNWGWIEERLHPGSDEFILALISSRRKHLMKAHHALNRAGYSVGLAEAYYTAPWTGTPGGLSDVVVFHDLRAPENLWRM